MNKETLNIILCYILWGLMPLFWKLLSNISPIYVLMSRIVWSFVFCFLLLLLKKRLTSIKKVFSSKKEVLFLLLSCILIALNWGLYIFAVNEDRILETSIAYYLSPILAIFIGVFLYNEKLHKFQWMAVVFAILGVIISIFAYGQFPYISISICVTFVSYTLVKKQVFSKSDTTMVIETLFLLPVALCFIIHAESISEGAFHILKGFKFLLLPLAGVLTSLPLMLLSSAVKKIPFSLVGILMFISPTLSFLIGVFIYKEPFTAYHLITFIFIWLAVLFFIIGNFLTKKTELR